MDEHDEVVDVDSITSTPEQTLVEEVTESSEGVVPELTPEQKNEG